MTRRPPSSPLFPSPPLFRSEPAAAWLPPAPFLVEAAGRRLAEPLLGLEHLGGGREPARRQPGRQERSEEHTSELQSLAYLVCRLLLEKKKTNNICNHPNAQ